MAPTPTAALTPEELAAIRERANAATEGPWLYRPHKMDDWGTVRISDAEEPYFVARAQAGGPTDYAAHRAAGTDPYERNGLFIAHARTDVPRLLDLIEALRAENERLTKERDAFRDAGKAFVEKLGARLVSANDALAASQERERVMREALEAAMRLVEEYSCRTDVPHIANDCDAAVAMCRAALAKEAADER